MPWEKPPPRARGMMAIIVLGLRLKRETWRPAVGPTSPRNQVVRKPKRTASLASRSYQGTPMLHVSQSSPFQRSRAQAEAPTSRSTTRGLPSISQRPKYACGDPRGGLGHYQCLGTACMPIPPPGRGRSLLPQSPHPVSACAANFLLAALFLYLLFVIPTKVFFLSLLQHFSCPLLSFYNCCPLPPAASFLSLEPHILRVLSLCPCCLVSVCCCISPLNRHDAICHDLFFLLLIHPSGCFFHCSRRHTSTAVRPLSPPRSCIFLSTSMFLSLAVSFLPPPHFSCLLLSSSDLGVGVDFGPGATALSS